MIIIYFIYISTSESREKNASWDGLLICTIRHLTVCLIQRGLLHRRERNSRSRDRERLVNGLELWEVFGDTLRVLLDGLMNYVCICGRLDFA